VPYWALRLKQNNSQYQ